MLTAETASTLTGLLQRIIYHKAESGFVIASFQVEGQNEPITIKGTLGGFNEDKPCNSKDAGNSIPSTAASFW
ncbi:MAG: YrrC family ATP-dependent DNA helicase [bacterium]